MKLPVFEQFWPTKMISVSPFNLENSRLDLETFVSERDVIILIFTLSKPKHVFHTPPTNLPSIYLTGEKLILFKSFYYVIIYYTHTQ